jgi:hypothetical protein
MLGVADHSHYEPVIPNSVEIYTDLKISYFLAVIPSLPLTAELLP